MAVLTTGRLPVRLTPLVGREAELGAVIRALAGCRLLTLTGPGGAGKTRLALGAATRLAGQPTPDPRGAAAADVAWVELSALNEPQVVAPTVAARLGVPDTPGMEPAAAIVAHLAARRDAGDFYQGRVLVVLDNCEHLAAGVADLAETLLAECPSLSILATSREPLGVEGERSWLVPPLAHAYAARLFEERARLVAPSFAVTDANRQAVTQVCQRLDGLPLAIELAAARMRVLSVRQLAERLDDVFGVLTGGARSAPPRHQALRATLDWSHDLLNGRERTVFRRLAVFTGGFALPAAERVVAFGVIQHGQVLDLLTRLVDKSLLTVDGERYHLLATIREYAADKLAQAGERDEARRAHLDYYTEFTEEAGDRVEHATAAELEDELDRLDAERANLRAATEYARNTGDAASALRIVGQLGRYAYLRGHYHEVRELMDQAVAADPAAPPPYRARALYGSGRLAHLQCDYEPAVRRLDAALLLYRELGDDTGIAACLQALGSVAREQGRYVRSAQLHAESLDLARAVGDPWAEASAHNYLGFVSWLQGDLDLAVAECTQALTMFRALGDVEGTAWSLISLGVAARYRDDLESATTLLSESAELSRSIGFREGIAWCEEQLGLVALERGDLPDARARLRLSYATHHDLRDRWRMASVLEDLAAVVTAEGGDAQRAGQAAGLLGLAQATREAIGAVLAPCERPQHDRSAAAAIAALGEAGFEAAWQRGTAASDPDELAQETRRPQAQASAQAPAGQRQTASDQETLSGDTPTPTVSPGKVASPFPGLVTSPLTGATPVLTDPSLTSPPPGAARVPPGRSPAPASGPGAAQVPPGRSPAPMSGPGGATPVAPVPPGAPPDLPAGPAGAGNAGSPGRSPALPGAPPDLPAGPAGAGNAGSPGRSPAPDLRAGPAGASPGSSSAGSVPPGLARDEEHAPPGHAPPGHTPAGMPVPAGTGQAAGSAAGPVSSASGAGSAALVRDDGLGSAAPGDGTESESAPGAATRPAGRRAVRVPAQARPGDRPSGPLRVRALGRATVELGGTALTAADWGYAKPRELLFLLITSPPLTREQVGAALWPEFSSRQLGNALHTALRELRRALGDHEWIVYAAGHYSVNRDRTFDCDVDVFESSLAAAGRARPPSAGLPDLRRAIAAYGGDFLAGMTTGEWAHVRRDELRRRFETALLAAGRMHMAAGKYQAAVTLFRRAVEHEPLNESAHRELMTCWAELGETARAVRHYAELTALLNDQVGVPPAAETTALAERLSGRG